MIQALLDLLFPYRVRVRDCEQQIKHMILFIRDLQHDMELLRPKPKKKP